MFEEQQKLTCDVRQFTAKDTNFMNSPRVHVRYVRFFAFDFARFHNKSSFTPYITTCIQSRLCDVLHDLHA